MSSHQQGFSYLVALFMVAVLAVVSVRGVEVTVTKERRMKELELLYVGHAYRTAIKNYYDNTPGTAKQFPRDLASLLEDSRTSRLNRHLRKLYADPISGSHNWGIVTAPDGGIMGVYSLSTFVPIKVSQFQSEYLHFTNAKTYQDWKFIYQPN
ncbi:type II secretion system protein [Undibacterium sp. CY21W]|uniref:type II secretion system protein n=1 Tax=Undibacterium sp. CY21W TaxID=2762293 RepID=UPI00164C3157|nr:type II secretion system protein [Undibacterium sp. CY21W]MBC3929998.1 type II secretion system protein [Undibacterium sp. CY21W]